MIKFKDSEYKNVPDIIINSLDNYAENGIPTGGFLRSVLENNLIQAVQSCDAMNKKHFFDIVKYVWNEIPSKCWGSPKVVGDWITTKRVVKSVDHIINKGDR